MTHFGFFNVDGDFEIVSIDNLHTEWEGEAFEIVVYRRRADAKILVKYPSESSSEGSSSWEGNRPDDKYCLAMYETSAKFNGENGRLVDTDGEKIKCYISSTRQPDAVENLPAAQASRGKSLTYPAGIDQEVFDCLE